MPFSAVDAISPALDHTKRQLLQPFRFGQWMRLALVGLLAGELSSGGCNLNVPNFNGSHHAGGMDQLPGLAGINPALFAGLILTLFVTGFVLWIVFLYISSVMRFILFDSILAKECHIRDGWNRRQSPAWRYFLWKIIYTLAMLGVLVILVGIPAGFAFAMGWFTSPKQHLLPLILGGITLFFLIAIFIFAMAIVYVLTKDFVVPQMALEGIGVTEGWRRLWAMIQAEKAGYAGYVGMKILLAIGAGIVLGIAGVILMMIVLIPAAAIAIGAIFAGKAAGLTWTAGTITLAIVAACVLFAVFMLLSAVISVPAIVFFPAYSIYFFAARYPALSAVLYPAPPAAPAPPISPEPPPLPPQEPPPLPPSPEPIG